MTADKEVTLSDGRIAKIRPARGRDLEKGAAVARNAANPMSLMMGVASQITTLDGKPVVYDDLLEWPIADVFTLIGELVGNAVVPSLPSGISSSSGAQPA